MKGRSSAKGESSHVPLVMRAITRGPQCPVLVVAAGYSYSPYGQVLERDDYCTISDFPHIQREREHLKAGLHIGLISCSTFSTIKNASTAQHTHFSKLTRTVVFLKHR
ncbi:hypothetical protein AVEN_92277-1 [Araneus ventricosus]|uniref:Uncharacterized protein n=1 Tax=Araneus ventricosus TaxID=182803 RepID=A0A4Y2AKT6_ARAVE|nr:hypothetical protein AVEN_92277-1 [Araneus ventricosus]